MNAEDRHDKGRSSTKKKNQGGVNGRAKLTETDVVKIRDRLSAGATQAEIVRDFGVTQSVVSMIKHRKSWAHI